MAQIIKLRNVPTPVVDVTYVTVQYPNFIASGEIEQTLANNHNYLEPHVFEGADGAQDVSPIINNPPNLYADADSVPASLGSFSLNPKGF